MISFTTESPLASCDLAVSDLQRIERRVLEFMPQLAQVDQQELKDSMKVGVTDRTGTSVHASANNLAEGVFPDFTRCVDFSASAADQIQASRIRIEIRWRRTSLHSFVRVEYTGTNSREVAMSALDILAEEVLKSRNWNRLLKVGHADGQQHPMIWIGIVGLAVLGVVLLVGEAKPGVVPIFAGICGFLIFYGLTATVKPWTEFDSRRQRRLTSFWNWLVGGIILSIVSALILRVIP